MHLLRNHLPSALILFGIFAAGCSTEPTNIRSDDMVPAFTLYNGTRYRSFSFDGGNAHPATLVAPPDQSFQILFLVQDESEFYPVEVVYHAPAYGEFGMTKSKAHQLGFCAGNAADNWEPFIPHPLPNEDVFIVCRTMDQKIVGRVAVLQYGDWMVKQIAKDTTILDLSGIEAFERLDSYAALVKQLEKMSFWTEFNSRFK